MQLCSWVCSHFFSFLFFIFVKKRPNSLTHHWFCWEQWALSNRSTSMALDPKSQHKNKCVPLWPTFSLCIHESWTLGKLNGMNLNYYWECLWQQLENVRNLMRTWWKCIGNKKRMKKSSSQRKNWTPQECMQNNKDQHFKFFSFNFQNYLSPFLACAHAMAHIAVHNMQSKSCNPS